VRVLATSREPLAVAGEARYRLGPLTLPAPGDPVEDGRSEAVALFADRARRADAGFVLDGQAGPAVARLVAGLAGMPLAIELAAARVEALGVAGLLDRLGDRFALLTGGDRLAAGRQRSLEATPGAPPSCGAAGHECPDRRRDRLVIARGMQVFRDGWCSRAAAR
jgi:predicted ATPase